MLFELFDWKIKLGIILTLVLGVGSLVSFIYAWSTPEPTSTSSFIVKFMLYRWFLFFIVSSFSIGVATVRYYEKRFNF